MFFIKVKASYELYEKISGNKNELALRASNANQVIYGANSSVYDDV
jgi:hypothetical protein